MFVVSLKFCSDLFVHIFNFSIFISRAATSFTCKQRLWLSKSPLRLQSWRPMFLLHGFNIRQRFRINLFKFIFFEKAHGCLLGWVVIVWFQVNKCVSDESVLWILHLHRSTCVMINRWLNWIHATLEIQIKSRFVCVFFVIDGLVSCELRFGCWVDKIVVFGEVVMHFQLSCQGTNLSRQLVVPFSMVVKFPRQIINLSWQLAVSVIWLLELLVERVDVVSLDDHLDSYSIKVFRFLSFLVLKLLLVLSLTNIDDTHRLSSKRQLLCRITNLPHNILNLLSLFR